MIKMNTMKQNMKNKFSLIAIISLLLFSCERKNYKYEIHGNIYIKTDEGQYVKHPAIWITDTISFDGDTIYYENSDGSIVRIMPPYILKDNTLNK